MKKENYLSKIKRFNNDIRKSLPNLSYFQQVLVFLDFMKEYIFHGAYLIDYIQYDFYGKTRSEREKYIVFGKLVKMKNICNSKSQLHFLDNKYDFCKKFKKFLHRDTLDCSNSDISEFKEFIKNKDSYFVKNYDGSCGIGVNKVNVYDINDLEKTFISYKENKCLCEEFLTQCTELKEFNNTSINTLRVVTIRKADGNINFMGGLLRMGRKGRIADNFHHNGIVAFLDGDTGVVTTTGVDKAYKRYIYHPDSGKQIVGFRVPVWEKVKEVVKEAALLVPELRYIGWDICITENYEIAIIEGNSGAEPDGEQITTKTGRWPLYWNLLKDIKDIKN